MDFAVVIVLPWRRFIPAGHAVIGQHVAVTSSLTMAGADTHAAADPTMFFISLVVGATVILLIWLIRRTKAQGGDTRDKSGEYRVIWLLSVCLYLACRAGGKVPIFPPLLLPRVTLPRPAAPSPSLQP